MTEHETADASVSAWLLGVLEAGEARRVAEHVQGCAECRAAVARLTPVVGSLALGVDEIAPPAGLRERILQAAGQAPAIAPEPAAFAGPEPQTGVIPLRWGRRGLALRRLGRVPVAAVAAMLVAAVLAGALADELAHRGTPAPPPPPSEVARFTLTGHGAESTVTAHVVYVASEREAVLTFEGLPLLPSGKVYELWLITPDNHADPAAVFLPDVQGTAQVLVYRSLAHYKLMAVTVEAGPSGVQSPTQQPQIYGTIT